MKNILATVVLSVCVCGPAFAAASVPIGAPLYTCAGNGLSRVAFTPDPAPCCSGQFGCPQLLSNTGLIKPKHSNRT